MLLIHYLGSVQSKFKECERLFVMQREHFWLNGWVNTCSSTDPGENRDQSKKTSLNGSSHGKAGNRPGVTKGDFNCLQAGMSLNVFGKSQVRLIPSQVAWIFRLFNNYRLFSDVNFNLKLKLFYFLGFLKKTLFSR